MTFRPQNGLGQTARAAYNRAVSVLGYSVVLVGAYLLGSIPTGYCVGRARGLDIRKQGSGNIGATNVFRVLGKGPGIAVLLADALKGALAVLLLPVLARTWDPEASFEAMRWVAALAVILGHSFTFWLRFRGGKGVATSAGVLAALVPWAFLIALAVFLATLAASRFVSLSSMAAAVVLPIAVWLTPPGQPSIIAMTGIMSLLVLWKHRANWSRLRAGTEPRLGPSPTSSTSPTTQP